MKRLSGILLIVALVLLGCAVSFQVGRGIGFESGGEWAIVQADILAREAGVFMPVYMRDGNFRVIVRQPVGLYKRAWREADRHDDAELRSMRAHLDRQEAREQTAANEEMRTQAGRKI